MTLQEENERLCGLLREFCERVERGEVRSKSTYAKFRDALSQQEVNAVDTPEPCEFHEGDHAACQQYSRQVPCHPTPAQDEREAFEVWSVSANKYHASGYNPHSDLSEAFHAGVEWQRTRPAQTAPQMDQSGLTWPVIELLDSVRMSDEEAKQHGSGATYWNNAVVACQVAIRDALSTQGSEE